MTRLLIDGTPISQNAKGVGRYAYQLCLQLAARLPRDWELQVLAHPETHHLFPKCFPGMLVPVKPSSEIANAFWVIPAQARKLKSQVLLKTHESAVTLDGLPTVTVCHDIDHLIAEAQDEKRSLFRLALDSGKHYLRRRALRKSDFLICNSQFTRKAVEEYYQIPFSRTRVGYCGVDPRFYELSRQVDKAAVRKHYGVENFILTFATGDARENFRRCPAVAARMAALDVPACLLVAGLRPDQSYALLLRAEFKRLGLAEGRHFLFENFLGAKRFQDLVSLYTAADLYLDLSLHEGFGMQLAEAMACGATCISSARGALAEIGDRFVRFVDPTNVEEIAQAIKAAYDHGLPLRDNREQVSYTHKFSWDSAGMAVTEALLAAVNRGPLRSSEDRP
jgi:glycosyltransferase involved in cell wall biosynthesis